MAEQTGYQRVEQLPPNYLAQFFAGGAQGVPGLLPLINQELVNRLVGMGVEGATPYTYTGQRIADFTPAQREAFRLAGEGVGAYLPFYERAEGLTERGVRDVQAAQKRQRQLIEQGVQQGRIGINEAQQLLRQVPDIARQAAGRGTQISEQALAGLGEAGELARGAGIRGLGLGALGEAGADIGLASRLALGARPELGEAQAMIRGAGGELGRAGLAGMLSTRGFDPRSAAGFYDPFEQQVVQQTLQDVREGLAGADIGARARAISSGAFGGARSRLAREELAERAARGAAEQIGALRSAGFGRAQQQAQTAFEQQQQRQAQQARLLSALAGQRGQLGQALSQTELAGAQQALAQAGQLGNLEARRAASKLAQGQALNQSELQAAQQALAQSSALRDISGRGAAIGSQIAGLGSNLASTLGTAAGGLGSLGGSLANLYGGAGRDIFAGGLQAGQFAGQAGQQMAGLGGSLSNLLGTDIGRLSQLGAQQQAQQQRALDLAYQNFVGQYNLPLQTFGQFGQLVGGLAPALGGTTIQQTSQSAPQSNQLMQGLGTAIAAYGALQGNPLGALGAGSASQTGTPQVGTPYTGPGNLQNTQGSFMPSAQFAQYPFR